MTSLKKAFRNSAGIKLPQDCRHKISFSPEDCRFMQWYTFTYNPPDQPQYGELTGLEDWIKSYQMKFLQCNNCDIYCVPEFSKMGRLHFHGAIRIHEGIKFWVFDIHKLKEGSFEIDELTDPSVWRTYMFKQHNLILPLITDEHHCFYLFDSSEIRKSNAPEFQ